MGEGPKDLRTGSTASGDAGTPSAETAMLRAEIEQKRTDISETLDEIQGRLRPGRIVSQATGTMRDAASQGLRQAGSAANQVASSTRHAAARTVEQAREHPWSAAAAAAGIGALAWWLAARSRDDEWDDVSLDVSEASAISGVSGVTEMSEEVLYRDFGDDFIFDDEEGVAPLVAAGAAPFVLGGLALGWWFWSRRGADMGTAGVDDTSWNGGTYGSAGADAGSYRTFGERRWQEHEGGDGVSRVRRAVSDVASRARDLASTAGERTREVADRAQRQVTERGRSAAGRVSSWVDENPLGAGFAALFAGLLIGLAIPESNRERRVLGGARDRLVDSAKRAGRDAVTRARQTVVDAATGRHQA